MTKEELLQTIIAELGANYNPDDEGVIAPILDDVITDALFISNRRFKKTRDENWLEPQLDILSSEIKKAVKTIYLQRGSEDVISSNQSGMSMAYANAKETMRLDIIRNGKRIRA